jgi:hypothetical protein
MSDSINLGGTEVPKWALFGAAGLGIIAFLSRKKEPDDESPAQPSGLLIEEFNQRLEKQMNLWKMWLEIFLNNQQGPVTPPAEPISPPDQNDRINPCKNLTDPGCHLVWPPPVPVPPPDPVNDRNN